jgi:hypothetical protein
MGGPVQKSARLSCFPGGQAGSRRFLFGTCLSVYRVANADAAVDARLWRIADAGK